MQTHILAVPPTGHGCKGWMPQEPPRQPPPCPRQVRRRRRGQEAQGHPRGHLGSASVPQGGHRRVTSPTRVACPPRGGRYRVPRTCWSTQAGTTVAGQAGPCPQGASAGSKQQWERWTASPGAWQLGGHEPKAVTGCQRETRSSDVTQTEGFSAGRRAVRRRPEPTLAHGSPGSWVRAGP